METEICLLCKICDAETLTVFITYGNTVNRKGIQVRMQEMHLERHVAAEFLIRSYESPQAS
jgi:hypothetical protein